MRTSLWAITCLLVVVLGADRRTIDEATESMGAAEETRADQALRAVRSQESPEVVQRKVSAFLDSYPGSCRRREVRNRLVEAQVRAGRLPEAVDECMRQAFDLAGSSWGDRAIRDSWLQTASLFREHGNLPPAAQLRVQTYLRFPYQLENRQQLSLAVTELAQAGRHADVLTIGKLALIVLPQSESADVVEAIKRSLTATRGRHSAERFETGWLEGASGNPLADVAVYGQDVLSQVARADLANAGLLADKPEVEAMQKGVLYLFAGDLPQAARELQHAVAVARPDQKDWTADQAGIYFRWLYGSAVWAAQYRTYTRWGASGPDGVAGTDDDLANPFGEATDPGKQ